LFDAFYKGGAADESKGAEIAATLRKLFPDSAAKRPVVPAPSAAKGKPTREEPAKTEPKRILIVDDEPTILLTLSYALRSSEVEVITASRLEPAEEALARYAFDVVIVDIRMSGILGIEGLELLSYIKRYWPKTEVMVMTAHGSTEIEQEAYGRGASYYYEKPVDILELAERVRRMGIPVKG
jgi:CheY-like chemotaxis protein